MNSQTPETDAFAATPRGLGTGYYQALAHARRLERQRNALADYLCQLAEGPWQNAEGIATKLKEVEGMGNAKLCEPAPEDVR